ncbi:MAG: zf-HC2 domain-containing protein [bacterium]|nr:zf-HC2 domain-containing protein [bacterium]
MSCKKIQQKLIGYYYQELDGPAMSDIARHLETCDPCRQAYIQIKKTLTMVAREQVEKNRSSAFWQDFQYKVYQKLEAEKEAGSRWHRLLIPRRLAPALAGAVILLLLLVTSKQLVKQGTELNSSDLQVVEDLELIENYELIQDLEMLENLPEAEQLRG